MTTHFIIPDTQVKPGVPIDHLGWIGRYIVERHPDVIVHLGDHWDMESLSHWSSKMEAEGRRYQADVDAGNAGFRLLNEPLMTHQERQRQWKVKLYNPRKVFVMGNHEHRISRCVDADPKLEGFMSLGDLDTLDWEVVPFLEPVNIDGVRYAHYWYNPMTGKPYGGAAATRLKNIGHSFVMGHQQTLDVAVRFVDGQQQWGIVAGACYLHDEGYKGPQGNAHWRGVVVLHQVENGGFDPMFVSLDYLCRKYEGVDLGTFCDLTKENMSGVP
jgi:hypothetical protein